MCILTLSQKEETLRALLKMRDDGPVIESAGICGNLGELLSAADHDAAANWLYSEAFAAWPEYSGNAVHPVPSPVVWRSPREAYIHISDVWKGPYGESRKRLLNFLIERLQAAVP